MVGSVRVRGFRALKNWKRVLITPNPTKNNEETPKGSGPKILAAYQTGSN